MLQVPVEQDPLTELITAHQSVKVRIAPTLYDPDARNYRGWPGVSWAVTLETARDAQDLRMVLEQVFAAIREVGVHEVLERLTSGEEPTPR